MVQYICPRCNYTTNQRCDVRNHFTRKHFCTVVNEDISMDECILRVLGNLSKNKYQVKHKLVPINTNESKIHHNGIDTSRSESKFKSCSFRKTLGTVPVQYKNNKPSLKLKIYKCPGCKKTYSTNSNLCKHIRRCKHKSPTNSSVEDTLLMSKRLEKQDKIISEMREQLDKLTSVQVNGVSNTTYINNIDNSNTTYNIVINPFGKENTKYITGDYIKNLIDSGPYHSIPKLLKYIHFNPEHKENHNIKIPNKKQPYAEIFNGNAWEYRDKKTTINDMSERAFTLLNEHYVGGNEYMNKLQSEFEDRCNTLFKKIHRELEMMVINSQKHVVKK